MSKTMKAWVVHENSDKIEGKGRNYISAICELHSTAVRLSKGSYTSSLGIPVELEKRGGQWWGPVTVVRPTDEDMTTEEKWKERERIVEKAKSLGLSEEEIDLL